MIRSLSCISRILTAVLLFQASAPDGRCSDGFDLTPDQLKRLQKLLPNSLPKLQKNEPVHVLLIGDSVMNMLVHTEDDADTLKSYPGIFLSKLADQFYYTGGLRVVRPGRGKPEKTLEAFGKEITVRNASRTGRLMIHAMNQLAGTAWLEKPDIVMVSFGIGDAQAGFNLGAYRRAIEDVIDATRKNKADLILVGATPTLTDPPEQGLALTRPYVDTMKEVAVLNGVFFADLGDISWLVRVDEPMKNLEPPAPKKDKEAEDAKASKKPSAVTDSPVKIPLPEELDPDPDKRAARLFHQVATNLRQWFDHGGRMDLTHPNPALHRMLGRRLFTELLDGPRPAPCTASAATAELTDQNHCNVSYRLENTTNAALRVNLLPLVTGSWKPNDAETEIELKPGRKAMVSVSYTRTGSSQEAVPSHEALLRLPVMILAGGVARIEDLRARLQPLALLWNLGSQFNQEGGAALTGKISNTSREPLSGKWEAGWLGQKFQGDFKAPPGGDSPVVINIKLPVGNTPLTRQRGTLAFKVITEKLSLTSSREIEIIQNLGLKQTVGLFPRDQYQTDKPSAPPVPGVGQPGVTFRADADPDALYLTWEIQGINLVDSIDGSAASAEVNIDARSYGKRLMKGITEPVRVIAGAADGRAGTGIIQPWTFGNGYAVNYDRALAQGMMSSRPDGSRRLTLMLPRSLFHLHEWALGNGNSQLGISTRLGIWQPPDNKSGQGGEMPYFLFDNRLHRDDATSLAVLELTAQPTYRWTVHFN